MCNIIPNCTWNTLLGSVVELQWDLKDYGKRREMQAKYGFEASSKLAYLCHGNIRARLLMVGKAMVNWKLERTSNLRS